jgi:hypothetical protein
MKRAAGRRGLYLIESLEQRMLLSGTLYTASAGGSPSGANAQWYLQTFGGGYSPVPWSWISSGMDSYSDARLVITNLPAHTEIALTATEIKLDDNNAQDEDGNWITTEDPATVTIEPGSGGTGNSETLSASHSGQDAYLDYGITGSHVGSTVTLDFSAHLPNFGYWSVQSIEVDWHQATLSLGTSGQPIEGTSEGFFSVTRSGDNLSAGLPFSVTPIGGSAVSGTDFGLNSSYSFAGGQTLNNVQMNPISQQFNDQQPEWTKDYTVALTSGMGYLPAGAPQATLWLKDNDPLNLQISPVIKANTNDTNNNGFEDRWDGAGNGPFDPDLVPLIVTAPMDSKPGASVTLTVGGTDKVKLWRDPFKTSELPPTTPGYWQWDQASLPTLGAVPNTIYVEGIKGSHDVDDVNFTLSATDCGPSPTVFQPVTVRSTVVAVTVNTYLNHDVAWAEGHSYDTLVGTYESSQLWVEAPAAMVTNSAVDWNISDGEPFKDWRAQSWRAQSPGSAAAWIPVPDNEAEGVLQAAGGAAADTWVHTLVYHLAKPNVAAVVSATVNVGNQTFSPSFTLNTKGPVITEVARNFGKTSLALSLQRPGDPNYTTAGLDPNGSVTTNLPGGGGQAMGLIWQNTLTLPQQFLFGGTNYDQNRPGRFFYTQSGETQTRDLRYDSQDKTTGYYISGFSDPPHQQELDGLSVSAGAGAGANNYVVWPNYDTTVTMHDMSGLDATIPAWSVSNITREFHDLPANTFLRPTEGLRETTLAGMFNVDPFTYTDDDLPRQGVDKADAVAAVGQFPFNTTYAYTGMMYVAHNAPAGNPLPAGKGVIAFAENYDDNLQLSIDDTVYLHDTNPDVTTSTGPITLSVGWHKFDVRVAVGAGNSGGPGTDLPNGWNGDMGLGIDYTWPVFGTQQRSEYSPVRNSFTNPNTGNVDYYTAPDGSSNPLFVNGGTAEGKRHSSYKTYLMFSPGGPEDSPVPVAESDWHFNEYYRLHYANNRPDWFNKYALIYADPSGARGTYHGDPLQMSPVGTEFPHWSGALAGNIPFSHLSDQHTSINDKVMLIDANGQPVDPQPVP